MLIKNLTLISLLAILLSLYIGCNKSEESLHQRASTSSTDITPPSVFSFSPSDNSVNIGLRSSVSVSFNEAMDNSSMTANLSGSSCVGTLQLSSDNFTTCIKMSGSPASSYSNHTFTVSPLDNLSENTLYKIKVKATVKDQAGNTLTSDYTSVGFTTITKKSQSVEATISCRTRELKATPIVSNLEVYADSSSDYTGITLDWYSVKNAKTYGININLLTEQKYFDEIDNRTCTNNHFKYDSSISTLSYSSCNWRSIYFVKGSSHRFNVKAYDSDGNTLSTSSDNVTVGTAKPREPAEVWGASLDGQASLGWTTVAGASAYKVYLYESGNFNDVTPSVQGTATSATISGLTNGQLYEFRIKAYKTDGISAFSNSVFVTPSASPALSLKIDNVTVNQSVQYLSQKTNKTVVSGKPGIIRAFLSLKGDVNGLKGAIKLSGTDSIASVTPIVKDNISLHDTPLSEADESNCVVTFDLRSLGSSWFKPDAGIVVEASVGDTLDSSQSTYTRYPQTGAIKLDVVDQTPLYIKLVPLKTDSGQLSNIEINTAKNKIETLMNAMYPNHSITFILSDKAYDLTGNKYSGTVVTNDEWSEALSNFSDYRDIEINNTDCTRFYYGLMKEVEGIDYAVGGMAYRLRPDLGTSIYNGTCPNLTGIGLNSTNVAKTAAHEIGHNHARGHADSNGETNDRTCEASSNNDDTYPYPFARIGVMGYDSAGHALKSKILSHDVMSYCNERIWVSDYGYEALRKFQETLASTYPQNSSRSFARGEIDGTLISGVRNSRGLWEINSLIQAKGLKQDLPFAGYSIRVKLSVSDIITRGFILGELDHSDDRPFTVWINTTDEIHHIEIFDESMELLFKKDLPSRQSKRVSGAEILKKIGEGEWVLYPSNRGRRVVILDEGGKRRLYKNDNDKESLLIQNKGGNILEVNYPDYGIKELLKLE